MSIDRHFTSFTTSNYFHVTTMHFFFPSTFYNLRLDNMQLHNILNNVKCKKGAKTVQVIVYILYSFFLIHCTDLHSPVVHQRFERNNLHLKRQFAQIIYSLLNHHFTENGCHQLCIFVFSHSLLPGGQYHRAHYAAIHYSEWS